jgi:uncharacterized protein YndB with AHSA1/START domain
MGVKMQITIETTINAPMDRVWDAWTTPNDITEWNFAIEEWCCPNAKLDFKVGGNFAYRMEAKDGSTGFNFAGKFIAIDAHKSIEYVLGDDRKVAIDFLDTGEGIRVVETFEADDEYSAEQQRQGWQSILNNFKKYVEKSSH